MNAVSLPARADPLPASRTARFRVLVYPALLVWAALYLNLERLSQWICRERFSLAPNSPLGGAIEFFILEAMKVLLLLVLVVFAVGIVRSYFTAERTRAILAGKRESVGNVFAALLGVVTPFCSCSAVPLFIGFLTAGVPLGVTFSFLISAPMVNEVALALLFGLFGWKIAALYLTTGLVVAIVAGAVIGRLRMERFVEPWVYEAHSASSSAQPVRLTWGARLDCGLEATREIFGKVWIYVLLGIAVGAGIHGYVPQEMMAAIMGRDAWWSVPLSVIVGVPIYANAAGVIPIVHALLEKGAALGTVLAFMMSVVALSLPETIILRKVLRPPLIAAFIGVVAAGIVLVGYTFNALI
ncbi:MAG: permease [bacterium]